MSIGILDSLKRKRDICVKAIITSQNRAFMLTPALREQYLPKSVHCPFPSDADRKTANVLTVLIENMKCNN